MIQQHIHISNVGNSPAICFDTGLDPRSFARTKMSQCLIEQGFMVKPDGSHKIWRAAGVDEVNGLMRVWGPLFPGKRLDFILEEIDSPNHPKTQTALDALVCWIKAKMFLGETRSAINPGASIICNEDGVFFAPEHLSNRCLYMEGAKLDRYNCPDLIGINETAFCAGLMLYKILTGLHPYPSIDIYQDMREGIFLPIHLAIPNLNEKLSGLIKAALLLPVENKKTTKNGTAILNEILVLLESKETLFEKLPEEKTKKLEKERKSHLLKQNSYVKTKRFVLRNKYLLAGIGIFLSLVLFLVLGTRRTVITTEGMTPEEVIITYYTAFSELNDELMKACIQGADKSDINAAGIFHVIVKQREFYERTTEPILYPAQEWRDNGGELPSPSAFGVTDLEIEKLTRRWDGSEEEGEIVVFSVNYSLWAPTENYEIIRNDRLMLKRDRHGNWRIIEIERTER